MTLKDIILDLVKEAPYGAVSRANLVDDNALHGYQPSSIDTVLYNMFHQGILGKTTRHASDVLRTGNVYYYYRPGFPPPLKPDKNSTEFTNWEETREIIKKDKSNFVFKKSLSRSGGNSSSNPANISRVITTCEVMGIDYKELCDHIIAHTDEDVIRKAIGEFVLDNYSE